MAIIIVPKVNKLLTLVSTLSINIRTYIKTSVQHACMCVVCMYVPYWKCSACNMHVTPTLHAHMTVTLMLHACNISVHMTCMLQ